MLKVVHIPRTVSVSRESLINDISSNRKSGDSNHQPQPRESHSPASVFHIESNSTKETYNSDRNPEPDEPTLRIQKSIRREDESRYQQKKTIVRFHTSVAIEKNNKKRKQNLESNSRV